MTTTDRTVAAEARFVEEGHHTFIGHDAQGHFVRIVSDILGHTGKSWRVRAHVTGPGLPVIFTCCPDGDTRDGHPEHSSLHGITDCKHMAGAARRLEREGLAELLPPGRYGDLVTVHSRWVATDRACAQPVEQSAAYRTAAEGKDGDVFAGLA
jgi:hypothetical protein